MLYFSGESTSLPRIRKVDSDSSNYRKALYSIIHLANSNTMKSLDSHHVKDLQVILEAPFGFVDRDWMSTCVC